MCIFKSFRVRQKLKRGIANHIPLYCEASRCLLMWYQPGRSRHSQRVELQREKIHSKTTHELHIPTGPSSRAFGPQREKCSTLGALNSDLLGRTLLLAIIHRFTLATRVLGRGSGHVLHPASVPIKNSGVLELDADQGLVELL